MNKKQLIVAWVLAIAIFYTCAFIVMKVWLNARMTQNVHYSGWQAFVLVSLPPLTIGGLLIYTLRLRNKTISKDIKTERRVTLKQVIIVSVIVVMGLAIIFLPSVITNRPPWSFLSGLVMIVFYLTIVSYPIYLILMFIERFIKRKKK